MVKRCEKGTRRNKKTGECEENKTHNIYSNNVQHSNNISNNVIQYYVKPFTNYC